MARHTPYPKTRYSLYIILLSLCISAQAIAQDGFYKVFPSADYQSVSDLLVIDNNTYSFITSSYFYIVDGAGNIKIQKELKEGTSSYLESVIRDGEGNFWIACITFDAAIMPAKVLYKLNANGQVLKTVRFNDTASFEEMHLVPSSNNQFFMAYEDRAASGNSAVRVYMMDKNGNKLWDKQVSDTIHNIYCIKAGPNNSADLYYRHKDDLKGELVNMDAAGNITSQAIDLADPASADYYTSDFSRVADGFIFTGVVQQAWPLNTDGLTYKTDKGGKVMWAKQFNIRLGDNFFRIEPVPDGYIVLGLTGSIDGMAESDGDIILMKLDLQGNEIWTRALGGTRMDYARYLQVLNQHIVLAGQSSYPGQSVSVPALCKTNRNGEISSNLPFQPAPAASMKELDVSVSIYPKSLVQSAAGPGGDILSGGNLLSPEDDAYYPFVVRNDKNGRHVWSKRLSGDKAPLKVFKKIRPDEYIAVTETKDLFANRYDVYKLDDKGQIAWKKAISANGIKDVIATRDGGMLFTGTADISFVNYEILLIKLDASGNQQWHKTIGDLRVWETGRRIIETAEQDFLIVGNAQPEYDPTSSLYILKIDQNGNKRWSKTFRDGITIDLGYDVIVTPDQGYLFVGSSNKQPFTNKNILLIKTDKDGNLTWRKTHDLHLMDEGFQVINRKDGGFLLTGTTAEPNAGVLEKYIFIMKTDDSGNRKGSVYFGKKNLQTMNPVLSVLSSGDTILSGTSQEKYGKEYVFMTKLNDIPTEDPGGDPQDGFVKLYPNPSQGSSTLSITQPATGPVFISIYDYTGKKIRGFYLEKTGITLKTDIVVPGLPAGVYYVNVWLNGKMVTVKWLVV